MAKKRVKSLTAVDLFSGCGGLTVGLKQAGFQVIGAAEKDLSAIETYRTNHRKTTVWHGDICRLSAARVKRDLRLRQGELSLLAGCPPCQGFSTLRTRNGAKRNLDPQNKLVAQMLRFVKCLRPKAVMLENVPRLKGKKIFHEFCIQLQSLGYEVNWGVKDAARFGVPQRRKRLILLAGYGFSIPFADENKNNRTVRQAISKLPKPGKAGDPLHDIPERRSKKVLKLIRSIPKDGGSRRDLSDEMQLACHKRCDGFSDVYGRLAWDDVAGTITGGCFNPSKGRFLHPEHNRAITLREAALLQTFPRHYRFIQSAGKEATAQMIGNALPPELVRRHALEVKKALGVKGGRSAGNGQSRNRKASA